MITRKDAHPFFHWIFDISFVKRGGDATLTAVLGYNRSKLDCEEAVFCRFQRPHRFLEAIGVENEITFEPIVILLVFFFIFRIAAFVVMNYKLKH